VPAYRIATMLADGGALTVAGFPAADSPAA
jgi:hypothetical protein